MEGILTNVIIDVSNSELRFCPGHILSKDKKTICFGGGFYDFYLFYQLV